SRAMPSMMQASTTFKRIIDPGAKLTMTSSAFMSALLNGAGFVSYGAAVGVFVDVGGHAVESQVFVAAGHIWPLLVLHASAKRGRPGGVVTYCFEVGGDEVGLFVASLPAES